MAVGSGFTNGGISGGVRSRLALGFPNAIRIVATVGIALAAMASSLPVAKAGAIPYPLSAFSLVNTNADGTVAASPDGLTATITGGNNGSGLEGTTDLLALALSDDTVSFHYIYMSLDDPGFDSAGYIVNGAFTQLTDTSPMSGDASFSISSGDTFGFRVATVDNGGEPGVLTVSSFQAPAGVPEPTTAFMVVSAGLLLCSQKIRRAMGMEARRK